MEYKTPAVAEMGDRFATIDMGRKEGGCCAPFLGGAGPHLTQCGLDPWADILYLRTKWHLDPSRTLATHGPKNEGAVLLFRGTWFLI